MEQKEIVKVPHYPKPLSQIELVLVMIQEYI